jgi:transcription elongation GreA/GreB family factor
MSSQDVKELAYELDPLCWKSYSRKPKVFKQAMEARRVQSLREASQRLAKDAPRYRTLEERLADIERRLEALERAALP